MSIIEDINLDELINDEDLLFDETDEIIYLLEQLSQSDHYDVNKLKCSIKYNLQQLVYFYCNLAKDREPDDVIYHVKHKPHVHQLAYFNIGRGFPKELMDGHWCYIVKDMGIKAMVIPCTSIKEDSLEANPFYEMDIFVKDKNRIKMSRIQLADLRCIDYQRLDNRKNFFTVLTPRSEINEFIYENMFE